jgi:hypothetical protein
MQKRSKVLIAAAALIAVLAGASLYGLRVWQQKQILDRIGAEVAAKIVSNEGLLKERFFTDSDFRKYVPDFDNYSEALLNNEYFRVKIWNTDKEVLWSDNLSLIGKSYPNNHEVVEVVEDGKTKVEYVTGITQDVQSEFVGEKAHLPFVEVYVPIRFNGKLVGIAETYRNAGNVPVEVDEFMKLPTIAISALALAIIAALLWSAKRSLPAQPAPKA